MSDELPVVELPEDAWRIPEAPALNRLAEVDRPIHGRVRRLEIIILAAIIGFGYFSARTLKQQDAFQEVRLSQDRSLLNLAVSVANGNAKVNGLTQSVEAVTATLAQSSSKIGEVASQLGQRGSQIQDLNSRLQAVEIAFRKAQQAKLQANDTTMSPPTTQPPLVSQTASMTSSHSHRIDASIPMPAGTLAHQNPKGELDYWLVARVLASGERLVKVEPYGTSSLGIKAHSLEDGIDYTLTPQGDWLSIPDSDGGLAAASPRRRRAHRR